MKGIMGQLQERVGCIKFGRVLRLLLLGAALLNCSGEDPVSSPGQNGGAGSFSKSNKGWPVEKALKESECAAGYFFRKSATELEAGECTACAQGSFSLGGNVEKCLEWSSCAAGTQISSLPTALSDRQCEPCPHGTFSTEENQGRCQKAEACKSGSSQTRAASAIASSQCSPCKAGEYCPGGEVLATRCTSGTWDDDADPKTACVAQRHCQAGQYVGAVGSPTEDRSCSSCELRTFSTTENAAQCEAWTECPNSVLLAGSKSNDTRCGPNPVSFAMGDFHRCALLEDGAVKCWGSGSWGQLGNETKVDSAFPVSVKLKAGDKARAIAAGNYNSCALLEDGAVKCWGSGSLGRLGNGSKKDSAVPVLVNLAAGEKAKSITVGFYYSCAVLIGGTAKCWGSGLYGRLGNGSKKDSAVPVLVSLKAGEKVISLVSAENDSCALLQGGTIKCWGDGGLGRLGNGSTNDSGVPVLVSLEAGEKAQSIAVSTDHSCAILKGGAVKCWGSGTSGQLGNGTKADSAVPVLVSLETGEEAQFIAVGTGHSCIILKGGAVKCWGYGASGQLGSGAKMDRAIPVLVALTLGEKASALAIGNGHSCALLEGGGIKCWGNGIYGELGNGTSGSTARSAAPVSVRLEAGEQARQLAIGANDSCALLEGGVAKCWGLGTMTKGTIPIKVVGF